MLHGKSDGEVQFQAAAAKAISVARTFPGVTHDLIGGFHLSLAYECCYTAEQLTQIGKIGASLVWPAVHVRFRQVVCTGGAFLVLADAASQGALMGIVAALEERVADAGLLVHRFRAEEAPFHASLFNMNSSFPTAAAVPALNEAVPGFWNEEPIVVRSFHLQGTDFTWNATSSRIL